MPDTIFDVKLKYTLLKTFRVQKNMKPFVNKCIGSTFLGQKVLHVSSCDFCCHFPSRTVAQLQQYHHDAWRDSGAAQALTLQRALSWVVSVNQSHIIQRAVCGFWCTCLFFPNSSFKPQGVRPHADISTCPPAREHLICSSTILCNKAESLTFGLRFCLALVGQLDRIHKNKEEID